MVLQSGQTFGRYQLLTRLGEGGFAVVYRAQDPALHRDVALKVLHPHLAVDPEVRRRFVAEAQALARLRNPHIVVVHDVGEANGLPFFAMELIEGQPLSALLASSQGLPLPQAMPILRDVASAIDALHEAGLVHRDIKPANVMIDARGRAVLMDFGIARSVAHTHYTQAGSVLGTPGAMSPEQIAGRPVGPAADIYALGVLAYQVLCGSAPFMGDTNRLLYAHLHEAPPDLRQLRPGLPAPVYAAVAAALEKDPALRPASGQVFMAVATGAAPPPGRAGGPAAISPRAGAPPGDGPGPFVVPGTPVPARGGTSPLPNSDPRRVAPLLIGAVGVLVLAAVAVLVVLIAVGHRGSSNNNAAVLRPPATVPALVTVAASTAGPAQTAVTAGSTVAAPASSSPTAPPTPSATAPPPPSPPPPPQQIKLSISDVSNTGAFASAQGLLHVCYKFSDGTPGSVVHVRVATGSSEQQSVTDDRVNRIDTASGAPCQDTPPPPQALAPGGYQVLVYNASWDTVLDRYPFGVTAPSVQPPAPTQRTILVDPPPPTVTPQRSFPASPGLSFPGNDGGGVQMRIVDVAALSPAMQGSDFIFKAMATNSGSAAAAGGSLTVSSPDASLSIDDFSCNGLGTKAEIARGSTISAFDTSTGAIGKTTSSAPVVEIEFKTFPSFNTCSMTVRAHPQGGAATFLVRVAANDGSRPPVQRYWPAGAGTTRDQQGYPALPWRVEFAP